MIQGRLIRTAARLVVAMAAVAGLALSIGCAFGEVVTCDIGQVDVRATDTRHYYSFTLNCSSNLSGTVDAVYDTGTGIAQEQAKGPRGKASAKWACKEDPWSDAEVRVGGAGDGGVVGGAWTGPTCTRLQAEASRAEGGIFDLGYTPPVPYSAWVLDNYQRYVLAKQLENAIKARDQAAASDTPCLACLIILPVPEKEPIADLAVVGIAGPTTLKAGLSGTYTVSLKNQGDKSATVELAVVFAGRLDQTGQIVAGAGLACEVKRGDPGVNAGVYCTGGTLAAGATATVVVQGRGQSAGTGILVVNLNPSRAVAESDYANNLKQLNVTVN